MPSLKHFLQQTTENVYYKVTKVNEWMYFCLSIVLLFFNNNLSVCVCVSVCVYVCACVCVCVLPWHNDFFNQNVGKCESGQDLKLWMKVSIQHF